MGADNSDYGMLSHKWNSCMKLPSRLREQPGFGILAYYKHREGKAIYTVSYTKHIYPNSQLDIPCSLGYIMGT